MKTKIRFVLSLITLIITFCLTNTSVSAHGYLLRAIPEDRSVLERSPVRVQYWFSEDLEPEFSSIKVMTSEGVVIAEGGVNAENRTMMEARLPTGLANDAYLSELRVAFASDGHVIVETRVFFVGEINTSVTGTTATDQPVPLEVVWRAIILPSMTVLFGVFALYSLALLPAWGNPDFRAGLLPPRVINRLAWIAGIALVVALLGNVFALLQQTSVFFGAGFDRVIRDGLWSVVRIGTRFGDTWNVRMILLVIVGVFLFLSMRLRRDQPETLRAFWVANTWAMALAMGTLSISSHAAGSLLQPWIAILADWLHLIAVGIWAGGASVLALILPVAVSGYQGDIRQNVMRPVLRRFSLIATGCLVLVITTGIYSSLTWFYEPADINSTWGGTWLIKMVLVAILVLVGAGHHITTHPERYAKWTERFKAFRSFIPTLRLEALLVLLVLVSVAMLSATPVPAPPIGELSVVTPTASQTLGDYHLTLTITPGGPGVNTYDMVLLNDGEPYNDASIHFRAVHPQRDLRSVWHVGENIGDGVYVTAGADIDRSGHWWTLVEFLPADETTPYYAAFEWDILANATIETLRTPNVLHVMGVIGIFAGAIFAIHPLLNRFYRKLDLSPVSITIGIISFIVGIAVIVVGAKLGEESNAQFEALVNPPPSAINIMLPTLDSVQRGETLLSTACEGWSDSDTFTTFIRRLDRTRDDDLYQLVTEGGSGLPACANTLTENERWDIVNFLRSLENPLRPQT